MWPASRTPTAAPNIVTQITTVKVPPDHQSEVLELMAERARFMVEAEASARLEAARRIRQRARKNEEPPKD